MDGFASGAIYINNALPAVDRFDHLRIKGNFSNKRDAVFLAKDFYCLRIRFTHIVFVDADSHAYAELARLRYDNGYTSYLEVVDAERSLFNAQQSYTKTKQTLLQASINTYKAMGGGWTDEAAKLAEAPTATVVPVPAPESTPATD